MMDPTTTTTTGTMMGTTASVFPLVTTELTERKIGDALNELHSRLVSLENLATMPTTAPAAGLSDDDRALLKQVGDFFGIAPIVSNQEQAAKDAAALG